MAIKNSRISVQYQKVSTRFGRLVQLIIDDFGFAGLFAWNPDHRDSV